MKLRTINYSIKQGIIGAWRNKYMVLASIGVCIATLFMFGIFALVVFNMQHLQTQMKQNYTIQAYFDINTNKERIDEIIAELTQKEDINEVKFVSKEEGANIWKSKDEKFAEVLAMYESANENPLSDSIIITTPSSNVDTLKNVLSTYSEISNNVRDTGDEMNVILKWTGYISVGVFVVMLIFLAISIFVISNTIKLGLYARRKEINIMKYIGAKDSFIKFPFIIEAILIGILATIITLPIISECYIWAVNYINNGLSKLNSNDIFSLKSYDELGMQLIICYIIAGLCIAILGSSRSIKKHLQV